MNIQILIITGLVMFFAALRGMRHQITPARRLFLTLALFVIMTAAVCFFTHDWQKNLLSALWGGILGLMLGIVFLSLSRGRGPR